MENGGEDGGLGLFGSCEILVEFCVIGFCWYCCCVVRNEMTETVWGVFSESKSVIICAWFE